MAVFWPTHHTLRGYWKHFGTSILRNQQATIFRWFLWRTWHQTGHKGQYLAYNRYVGKHGRFGAKSWNDGRWQVLVLPHGENTNAILFWSGMGKVLDFETMLQFSFNCACRFYLSIHLLCIRETNVWPKLTKNIWLFLGNNSILWEGAKDLVPSSILCSKYWPAVPSWASRAVNLQFDPKIMIFEANSPFFV